MHSVSLPLCVVCRSETVLAVFPEHTHIMFSYYVHLILLPILSYNFASGRVITSCIKNDENETKCINYENCAGNVL